MREAIALSLAPLTEEEQLRQAMAVSLQAPPTPASAAPADEDAELQAALALSMGLPPSGQPSPPTAAAAVSHMCIDETNEPEPEPTAEALAQLVFGADASPTVLRQWHSQGIRLGAAAEGAADGGTLPFGAGLVQEHGGPCAVLSAAQAFLLRRLLFDPEPTRPTAQPAWRAEAPAALLCPPAALAAEALLSGLADMLWGAALGGQGADADADAGAAPPAPGDASCVVALLPPELLPFEGSAAELQACLPRVTCWMHAVGGWGHAVAGWGHAVAGWVRAVAGWVRAVAGWAHAVAGRTRASHMAHHVARRLACCANGSRRDRGPRRGTRCAPAATRCRRRTARSPSSTRLCSREASRASGSSPTCARLGGRGQGLWARGESLPLILPLALTLSLTLALTLSLALALALALVLALTLALALARRERDDASEALLHPHFGHCAQEVLNQIAVLNLRSSSRCSLCTAT